MSAANGANGANDVTGANAAMDADVATAMNGAEAVVNVGWYMERGVINKRRLPKAYRHPRLDAEIRRDRARIESQLIAAARRAGVPVPVVYDVHGQDIVMERIEGPALRDRLTLVDEAEASRLLAELGNLVARLHEVGITHGDLTTSNVLVTNVLVANGLATNGLVANGLCLIDFGLGQITEEVETRGVDLHIVEEALQATDARADALWSAFEGGYQWSGRVPVLRRLHEIRERGRYR